MTKNFQKVFPNHFKIPEKIKRLGELAYNLWWVWNPGGLRLYPTLDRRLWEKTNHNPIAFLHQIDKQKLKDAANDRYFLEEYERVMAEFDQYMAVKTPGSSSSTPSWWSARSHISPLNLACTNPCLSMPAAWVFWRRSLKRSQRPGHSDHWRRVHL